MFAFHRSSSLVSFFSSDFDILKCPLKHFQDIFEFSAAFPRKSAFDLSWEEYVDRTVAWCDRLVADTAPLRFVMDINFGRHFFREFPVLMDWKWKSLKVVHEMILHFSTWRRASPSNRISIGGMAYSGGSGANSDGDGSVKVSFVTLHAVTVLNLDLLEFLALSGWQYPTPDIGVLSEGGTKNFVIWDKDEADHERLQAGKFRPGSVLHRQESRNPLLHFILSCT